MTSSIPLSTLYIVCTCPPLEYKQPRVCPSVPECPWALSPLSQLINYLPCSSICFDWLIPCSTSSSARSRRLCLLVLVVFASSTSSSSYRHRHRFALVIVASSTSSSTRPHRYINPVSIVFVAFVCTRTLVLCSVWSTVAIFPLRKPQTFTSCRSI